MVGKKGMSPIIATILLIAFAVALGAMIMNWSSSLVSGGETDKLCSEASLSIRSPVCFFDNSIQINVKNNGQSDLGAVILRIESPDSTQDIKVKNSRLRIGEVMLRNVPSIKPNDFVISLIPVIELEDGIDTCALPAYTTQELPACALE